MLLLVGEGKGWGRQRRESTNVVVIFGWFFHI